jgi:hypothetical protein
MSEHLSTTTATRADRLGRLIVAMAVMMALAFSTGMALAFEIALDAPVFQAR